MTALEHKRTTPIKAIMSMLTVAITASVFTAAAPSATSPRMAAAPNTATSSWYWTPAACKAQLQNYGVQTGDGRTYNVAKAYCVGYHDHCWLSQGLRRYKVFITVARSYDGVVRLMTLTVTGKKSWSGSPLKIIQPHMTAEQFSAGYGPAAWNVATVENQKGCWDIHP